MSKCNEANRIPACYVIEAKSRDKRPKGVKVPDENISFNHIDLNFLLFISSIQASIKGITTLSTGNE